MDSGSNSGRDAGRDDGGDNATDAGKDEEDASVADGGTGGTAVSTGHSLVKLLDDGTWLTGQTGQTTRGITAGGDGTLYIVGDGGEVLAVDEDGTRVYLTPEELGSVLDHPGTLTARDVDVDDDGTFYVLASGYVLRSTAEKAVTIHRYPPDSAPGSSPKFLGVATPDSSA